MDLEIYNALSLVMAKLWLDFTAVGVPNPPAKMNIQVGSEVVMDVDDCACGALYGLSLVSEPLEGSEQLDGFAWHQTYAVGTLRCIPTLSNTGVPPTPAEEDAALKQILRDQARLMQSLNEFVRSQSFAADGDLSAVSVDQLPPSGGCGGTLAVFTLVLSEDC
jgi:hypothetical protein